MVWFTLKDLGSLMRRHRIDGTNTRAIKRINRADLVCIDDIGLLPTGPDAAEGIFRVIDAAYERRSLAISSNLHPSNLDNIMPMTLAPPPWTDCCIMRTSSKLMGIPSG